MRITWRGAEFRLLLPIVLLVPLGFVVTNVALTGTLAAGDLTLAVIFVSLFVAAHVLLVAFGHQGDQLLLPAVGAMGGVGIVMLNRLPQDLAGTSVLGIEETVTVHIDERPWEMGNTLILCSDGLHGVLDAETFDRVARVDTDPQQAADALVHLAIERGTRDNVTAVVVRRSL